MLDSRKIYNFLAISAVLTLLPVWAASAYSQSPGYQQQGNRNEPASYPGENNSITYTGCGGEFVSPVQQAYEQKIVDLVNSARAENGLPPLKQVDKLSYAARYHAADMSQDNYFYPDTYDRLEGKLQEVCSAGDRIDSFYLPDDYWVIMGQNIGGGQSTPAKVMDQWMGSGEDRANILHGEYRDVGVGYYAGGGDYTRYWVLNFTQRYNVYPLIINADANSTASRTVSLYIYGDWQEMRLRNDDGPWSIWMPFQNQRTWSLNQGIGVHTVTAELRYSEQTITSSDDIYLSVDDSATVVGNIPDAINFTYSIPDKLLVPASQKVTPLNISDENPLAWSLSIVGTWFSAEPQQGITPQSFTVTPTKFDTGSPITYIGKIILSVNDPPAVEGSPHTIVLTLKVTNTDIFQVYFPQILKLDN